jgi:hypothetical protein
MTKGGIIENVLKEMRAARSRKTRRPAEEDKEEQDVIEHLEELLRDAECCTQCHWFMFPYDMCSVTKLKNGEYAWVCCAIGSVIKRASGEEILLKGPPPEQPAKSMGYKPFADFFGGKVEDDDAT